MKELEENHWTDDAELMERFVLHRLNPEELNELEDHLRICEVCKQAVRAEQVLVAGIRRGGRERLKASLRKKTEVLPEQHTPWGRILSAAAVIVIVLTVGVYNRWFEASKVEPSGKEFVLRPPAVQEAPSAEEDKARIPDQQLSQREEPQAQSKEQARKGERQELATPRDRAERSSTVAGSVVPKQKDGITEAPIAVQPHNEMAASIAEPESDVVWIEGTILSGGVGADAEKATREMRSAAPQLMEKKYDSATNASGAGSQDQQSNLKGIVNGLSLSQQNSISLPPAQQQLHKFRNTTKVLTRVERIGTTTQLTLYLDSLVDETALSNARFEMPRTDSLIVHLPHQRIAFKVPSGWNTRSQTK